MPATVRTLSGRGALDRARRNSQRQSRPRTGSWFGDGSGKGLAIRHSGYVLLGGASGASCLLLNTKASQEAACSRAPAAIVPSQQPESHDAGVSRFGENGSHPAEVDAAESYARQVDGPGSSGNTGIVSHPAATEVSARWRKRHKKHRDPDRGHGANSKGQKGQSPRGEATSRYVLTSGRCRLPRWPRRCRCAWQERISQRRAPRCRRR